VVPPKYDVCSWYFGTGDNCLRTGGAVGLISTAPRHFHLDGYRVETSCCDRGCNRRPAWSRQSRASPVRQRAAGAAARRRDEEGRLQHLWLRRHRSRPHDCAVSKQICAWHHRRRYVSAEALSHSGKRLGASVSAGPASSGRARTRSPRKKKIRIGRRRRR